MTLAAILTIPSATHRTTPGTAALAVEWCAHASTIHTLARGGWQGSPRCAPRLAGRYRHGGDRGWPLDNVCDHSSIFQPGSHRPSGRHLRAHVREPHRGATVSGETTEQHCRARGPYRGSPPSRSETTTQVGAGGFQPHRAALRGHLRGGKGRSSWGIGFTSCCAPGPSRDFVQPERVYNPSWC
jgi:hypothetical protein